MDFNNFYISGKRSECPVLISCLLVYSICDVNTSSLYFSAG